MCPKPTQPEEIDLLLKEMKVRGLMEDTPNSDKGRRGGEIQNQFEGASRSPYRDVYLKMHASNKSDDNQ